MYTSHSLRDGWYLLLKVITETSVNETKQKRGKFLSMLLGTLRASLLENL